jgi:Rrf2 family iron-sulfur cluster assembly transcriptional regulator
MFRRARNIWRVQPARIEADMKLTRSVSYAVGVLLQIQSLAHQSPVKAATIANGCRFPPRFLYRILHRLVDAGLLYGTSGPGGGYTLTMTPQRITLWDIVAGVEATPTASVLTPVCASQRGAMARVNQLCLQNAKRFEADLRSLTLADLARNPPARARARRVRKRGK